MGESVERAWVMDDLETSKGAPNWTLGFILSPEPGPRKPEGTDSYLLYRRNWRPILVAAHDHD